MPSASDSMTFVLAQASASDAAKLLDVLQFATSEITLLLQQIMQTSCEVALVGCRWRHVFRGKTRCLF